MYDDKAAITEVINLYSIALDAHSWDLFDAIFTPDVELHYANMLHWSGLDEFKRAFVEMHEPTFGHQHSLGVPQIVIETPSPKIDPSQIQIILPPVSD